MTLADSPQGALRGADRPFRAAIGVTGHRLNQIPEDIRDHLAERIALTLDLAAAAIARDAGADGFELVSALAEGADRFAAHAALARGWRLNAPLPFEVPRYLEDFEAPASRKEFKELLKKARSREVAASSGEGAAPYAAVGELIVKASHVLIAVWNGAPPKGPGGTAEVAARMAAAGGGVIWLPTEARFGVEPRLVRPRRLARAGAPRRRCFDAIARQLPVIPAPEAMRIAD